MVMVSSVLSGSSMMKEPEVGVRFEAGMMVLAGSARKSTMALMNSVCLLSCWKAVIAMSRSCDCVMRACFHVLTRRLLQMLIGGRRVRGLDLIWIVIADMRVVLRRASEAASRPSE